MLILFKTILLPSFFYAHAYCTFAIWLLLMSTLFELGVYTITQLPLRHRPQYKTEWMFEFIKALNNFGLPRLKVANLSIIHY